MYQLYTFLSRIHGKARSNKLVIVFRNITVQKRSFLNSKVYETKGGENDL
jgi:hypothetical protein